MASFSGAFPHFFLAHSTTLPLSVAIYNRLILYCVAVRCLEEIYLWSTTLFTVMATERFKIFG